MNPTPQATCATSPFRRLAALAAAVAVVVATGGQSPSPEPSASAGDAIASIPVFARIAADGASPASYTVPIHLTASLHKFIFSFPFQGDGTVSFEQPDHLRVVISSVPYQYARVFGELGTPRTWRSLYDLQVIGTTVLGGVSMYRLRGVPRSPSDVDHVVILIGDPDVPIRVRWVLRSGWTIATTVNLELVENFLVPAREHADITGHGYTIHSEMSYGKYALNIAPKV